MSPWIGLAASLAFLAILLIPVTRFNGIKSKDWFKGFVVIFSISWTIWLLSNYSPIVKAIGSPEVGYIIALLVGIVIANLTRLPSWLKNSARGELFIKTAIVLLLGAKILFTTFVLLAYWQLLGAQSKLPMYRQLKFSFFTSPFRLLLLLSVVNLTFYIIESLTLTICVC